MSTEELYCKGARVWIPDDELVWQGAILQENFTGQSTLAILYDEGEESKLKLKSKNDLPPLRNPEILIGENDLTSLSYLHEPAVLYNLQVRFCDRNDIYTYCGIVLVAINPYESLPIYDEDTIHAYSGMDMGNLDPHIYAVAEEAFKRMSRFDENQSLIVSGESGAGKTVSAKYAMRYFATVAGAAAETQVEKKVLASNPIMEAIGNAKTTRNDNSSRFGKYIEIGFSKKDTIVGANMRTYLLEKSRVVFQATDERNYHIFYQLCSSAEEPEFEHLKLNHASVFYYTNQGENPVIDGVDDYEELQKTREAFTLLGINPKKHMELFRVLAGILHLGNILFTEKESGSENCFVHKEDKHLPIMAELLGIDEDQIRNWLCNRKIVTANEMLVKPLTQTEAYFSRDALAKHTYAQLFDWIVGKVNNSLVTSEEKKKFIGVLDIYGFETFEINSFEQFCINYANEKLQQQFCLHVFKLEQEEYVRESIEWAFIDFYDNQPCIDLIESKYGVLDLLDEECKMPRGSADNWCTKLFSKHDKSKHFSKPRMSNKSFIIHHFADNVEYQSEGFLEKNRDTVLEEHLNILRASEYEFVAELFQEKKEQLEVAPSKRPKGGLLRASKDQPKGGSKGHKRTVGSQFRDSLNKLMETLFSTTPHYIRCIKPNDYKMPFTFDPKRAVQQLRACGVLETIRISAAGYPSRWTYPEFFQRYRVLAQSKQIKRQDMKITCQNILTKLIEDRDKYQFGKTKIFFRAGQVAYLEKIRTERLRYCGVMIQKHIRGWLAKRHYQKIRKSIMLAQTYGRAKLARTHAQQLRRTRSATILQAAWRRHLQYTKYQRILQATLTLQRHARGMFGRRRFYAARVEAKVLMIQQMVRGYLARRQHKRIIRGIVLLQSHVRRRAARKEFKRLKIEARSVEHIKGVAKGLELKIIQLQQKLDQSNKEVVGLRDDKVQVKELRNELEKLRSSDAKSKEASTKVADLQAIIAALKAKLETEKKLKEEMKKIHEDERNELNKIIKELSGEKESLKNQLEESNRKIKEQSIEKDEIVKQKLNESDSMMLDEMNDERLHHQRLVKDYGRLQQRYENLASEMQMLKGPGLGHRRSGSELSMISLDSEISVSTERSELAPSDGKPDDEVGNLDLGYGSIRGKKLANQKSKSDENSDKEKPMDIGLLSRLQNRVKELERARGQLERQLENREEVGQGAEWDSEREIYDAIKLQELEMENSKLKLEMAKMRKIVIEDAEFEGHGKGSPAAKEFMMQFEAMADELERRREECIQLRTLLSSRSRSDKGEFAIEDDNHGDMNNEDGEIELAFKTQKDINKLLQNELQRVQKNAENREKELKQQLSEIKTDSERQQKLISANLALTPGAKIEATMQHEISRLTSENLDLRESMDKQQEQVRKLKRALKIYAKRLKQSEASDVQAELEKEMALDEGMPSVKHYSVREYSGMFEYRKEEESLLIKNLIMELKPKLASHHLPGMPSYILFMCIRWTDHINDDEKVRTLLTNTINAIKKIVKKKQDDVETIALWLANTSRLLHNLKQYSGEKAFQNENTPKQNEHCLRNFDLSEYRQILSDLAVWIYQGLIKLMESHIHPYIVGAILEHEAIAGLSASNKPSGMRRTRSIDEEGKAREPALDTLLKAMNEFMRVLNVHAMDPELVKQIFRQLFYFICANSLNNLLLRKDMCHWSKGMQIRYNVSHLEEWLRDNRLHETGAPDTLQPIIQASQLLQARKTEGDVESIAEMCSKLTTSQIIKILNLYTPVNEFEERVPISFIRKIQEKLVESRQDTAQTLLMDTKFLYAVTFPFNPSNLGLETITAPTEWGLGFLNRL